MNNRAIKVDLSLFFNDERKMAYIFEDPNWKTVECLQRRVEHLFDISNVSFSGDGYYLHSKEPIDIVKYCEVIKAFVLESQEVRKKKKSKKCKGTSEEYNARDVNDELVTSTRGLIDTTPNSSKTHQLIEDLSSSKNPSKKRKSDLEINNFVGESPNVQQSFNSKIPTNPSKKRKSVNDDVLTTTRLSKIASSTFLNVSNLLEKSDNNQQLSSLKNSNNPFKKCKSSKDHIYFNEAGDILSSKLKKEKNSLPNIGKKSGTIVEFRCSLNDVINSDGAQPQKPRIFHLKSKNTSATQSIEIQEDILLPPYSSINAANKPCSLNEATIIDNVEQKTTENRQNSINSTISQTENLELASSKNLDNESENEEINLNETENKSMANKNATGASNVNKTEFSCIDEPVSETLTASLFDDNNPDSHNKSRLDRTSADKNHTASQMELVYVADQPSEAKDKAETKPIYVNDNSVMSVDCVDISMDVEDVVPLVEDDGKLQHNTDEYNKSSESDLEELSEVIDLNESELECSTTLNNSKQHISYEKIKVHNILPLSRDITELPSTDDIIIFKVPYKKNKKHASTNFIAGKVEYVNKRTKNIKLLILDGNSELCHVPSNFICGLDDSIVSAENHLQLKFADMVELKLFSMPC